MDSSVFISYRRSVSEFIARAVFQDLRAYGYDAFMDVESIPAGEFGQIILNQIAARPYFLIILAPGTLDRCNEPGDWLRREIEHAITLHRVIIPVMTPHFSFEASAAYLTDALAALPSYQALTLPHDYFEAAMERLRTRYLKPIEIAITPTPEPEQSAVQRKIEGVASAPTVTERDLSAQDYFERALICYMRNRKNDAVLEYRKALRLNPRFAEAYCGLGMAYRDVGYVEGAVESFHAALELQPDHPLAQQMSEYIRAQRTRLWQDPPKWSGVPVGT